MEKIELKGFSLTSAGINIEAASGDKKDKNAKFSILAYNGGVVSVGWYGDIVIDLAGISIPKQEIPILNGHRREVESVLGRTDKVSVEAGDTILASGILYSSTDDTAKGIVAKSKDGHPWESSVGIEPSVIEEILTGESETVNGKNVAGPVYVARKSKLKEISIVVHGADSETIVDIAAKRHEKTKKVIIIC